MTALERAGYLAHAGSPEFRLLRARTESDIARIVARWPRSFVAWSAGKDSSALLYLVATVVPEVPARMLTGGETRLLHENLDAVVAWWRERFPELDLAELHQDHVFGAGWEQADWYEQYRSQSAACLGATGWVTYLHSSIDADLVMLGTRAEESPHRRRLCAARLHGLPVRQGSEHYNARRMVACPLGDWTVQDIGALHAVEGIPLLAAYDEGLDARTKLRTGRSAIHWGGQLAELARRDPEGFARLTKRFPELRRYA